ncbi:hypothetical protein FRC06_009412 [Ceratobasidium sp. 370]|nr:hypothetical protein FRC06_009412 [Ceratobasidium sp. 370]
MQLERLSLIVETFDVAQYPELLEISSHLCIIKDRFEKEKKSRSRPGIPSAERRLQTLANLRQEISDFISNAQLRMLMQIRESNSSKVTTDQVLVIPEHEITNQVLMYEGPCEAGSLDDYPRKILLQHDNQDNLAVVRVNTRRGRYGALPVIYKTYSSHSNHNAAKNFNITVESNGQATLIPTLEAENSDDSVRLDDLKNVADNGSDTHLHLFLDRIATLDWIGFTELEITRLAAESNMLPMKRIYYWRGQTPPPFTVQPSSIGQIVERGKHQSEWHVLDEGKSPGMMVGF